jgi:hypothetical protein
MKDLSKEDWSTITDAFLATITDAAIDKAVHQLPAALHQIDAPRLAQKLKARRDALKSNVMAYYYFLKR